MTIKRAVQLIRDGLAQAAPHDHDHLAYEALDRLVAHLEAAERERDDLRGTLDLCHAHARALTRGLDEQHRDLATAREALEKIIDLRVGIREPGFRTSALTIARAALRSLDGERDTISNPISDPAPAKVEPWTESQLESVRRLRYDRCDGEGT